MNFKKLLLIPVLSVALCQPAFAERIQIDKVVATVNDGVVLQSEVDQIVNRVKEQASQQGTELPSDKVLHIQATDKLIDETLVLQLANRMGMIISDAHLDQTLANIAKEQGGTISDLRRSVEEAGDSFQAYREEIRKEITISQVKRSAVDRRVYISPQEIDNLNKILEQQSGQSEEYNIGHILIKIDGKANPEEVEDARERAENVIKFLNEGKEFKRIAIASSGGANALDGGQLGWMGINEMPTLFAEAIKGKKKDELVGPLRSGAGFHIVKVQDVRGREVVETVEVRSRHILLKPSIILSEEKARDMLAGFVKDLRAGNADFAELAKEHSEDPGSALKGGEYDWTDPSTYVPAFRDTLLGLEQNEVSEPFRSTFGWHIVELLDKRVADKTEQAKMNRAHQLLFRRKFKEESFKWMREMREQAHVEVLDSK
ncbi:peptidylprolyl isomerase SurA [Pseudoalteromonas luteoviolacea]|uniref:Chaperone SurA n=1 Tax=Pseudoalteromonas luteoviolacea H33 TaxID=1365251 RepID=A0A167EFI9_9GAMM|nr:peptidylprolyl isomerase SurA [Pseudoalteromonas luteoviolacea]KZN50685.1 peptidyl-prolyl cis-trans isomerase [Pseudoalteromonas luteoviolacea H33]KZN77629.1 peptidyl-prolyl cis-trans isomerase [Pseudoalteromonas luteoviolacea H33-S]MBQ4877587.1 peptidylprolyl isomerase SurA [Pseudoalteromonas luteoviolacea]MBQ4906622.1 peptidylprolyl isomerase SurA [Pseudoalteromonas luteoviolacea]